LHAHKGRTKLTSGILTTPTDIIELGIPFTDPIADGPTIQRANTIALNHGVNVTDVLNMVRDARARGLRIPVLLMGYYNPLLRYGEERMLKDARAAGVNGFIMVDLPPEEAIRFRDLCKREGLVFSTKPGALGAFSANEYT
jgi:tryptophan synthase